MPELIHSLDGTQCHSHVVLLKNQLGVERRRMSESASNQQSNRKEAIENPSQPVLVRHPLLALMALEDSFIADLVVGLRTGG